MSDDLYGIGNHHALDRAMGSIDRYAKGIGFYFGHKTAETAGDFYSLIWYFKRVDRNVGGVSRRSLIPDLHPDTTTLSTLALFSVPV